MKTKKRSENALLSMVNAIYDAQEDLMYQVDYINLKDEDSKKRANWVCVHFEDTYMVDNTVSSNNTRRIYFDEVLNDKSNRYITYKLTPFKFTIDK